MKMALIWQSIFVHLAKSIKISSNPSLTNEETTSFVYYLIAAEDFFALLLFSSTQTTNRTQLKLSRHFNNANKIKIQHSYIYIYFFLKYIKTLVFSSYLYKWNPCGILYVLDSGFRRGHQYCASPVSYNGNPITK